jgi:hypothetical protein
MRSNGAPSHQSSVVASPRRTLRIEAEPDEFRARRFAAHRIDLQRGEIDVGALETRERLSARRGAGVEETVARPRIEDLDCELRPFVLHAHVTFTESGQRRDADRRPQHYGIGGDADTILDARAAAVPVRRGRGAAR